MIMDQSAIYWQPSGEITKSGEALLLPDVTTKPGLYRLRFKSGAIYIGEANNLQRRLGDYIKYYPSSAIESEFRINKRLNEEEGASVDVMLDDSFVTKSARCVREHIEIKQSGPNVINGGTLRDRIAFYKSEIERLEKTLARSEGTDLDELMHHELLSNERANAMADALAIHTARKLGFGEDVISQLGGASDSDMQDEEHSK